MSEPEGKQKKCNKHGYYWVGLCLDGTIADDICPACLKAAAPELLDACKEFVFLEKTNMTKKQVQLRIDITKDIIAKAENN